MPVFKLSVSPPSRGLQPAGFSSSSTLKNAEDQRAKARGCWSLTVLAFFILSAQLQAAFRFVDSSDPHFGAGDNATIDTRMLKEIDALLPKPALLICTGDIADYGTAPQYETFNEAFKNLSMPFYIAPGNHDVRWNPLGKEGYVVGAHGPLYQSWDVQNIHFVLLDSTVLLEHWGHISQQQLDWLKADLEKAGKEKPVIIGFHHWIGRDTVQVDNEQELMKLVEPYNVVLWLQGHGHQNLQWNVNGTPAIMVGALYNGSYLVCDVDDNKIARRLHRWKDPKKSAEMMQTTSRPSSQEPEWIDLPPVSLKRAARPDCNIGVASMSGATVLRDVPADSKADVSEDGRAYHPLTYDPDRRRFSLPPTTSTAGEHTDTVRLTLADGSAWFYSNTIPPAGLVPSWQSDVGGAVQSRVALRDQKLFVPSMGNDLVCLAGADGRRLFSVSSGGPIFSAPDVDGPSVYFGSADHCIYAADANSGTIKWKFQTGGAVLAGPATAKGIVCVGSTDTKIYGLDARDGKMKWTVDGGNMYQSKTATDGERFFVGGWDNHFRCIDAATGKVSWDLQLGRKQTAFPNFSAYAPAITSPAVGAGCVFVSTNDGVLHALAVADGKQRWAIDWKKMGYSSPLYHDGKVYAALSDEGKVFCADAADGTIIWQGDAGSVIYDSGFCFGGGKVFIGTVSGLANAFDAGTGHLDWRFQLPPGHVLATPVADDKMVYFASMNNTVTALPIAPQRQR